MIRWTLLILLGVGGCAWPMTRREFVKWADDQKSQSERSTYTVERPFGDVISSIRSFQETCLSIQIRHSFEIRPYTLHLENTLTVIRVGEYAEFTHQRKPDPMPTNPKPEAYPERGAYFFAADIQAVDAKRTKVTVYRWTFSTQNLTSAFRGLCEGKKIDCPDIEG
jgi:hypothetical protein